MDVKLGVYIPSYKRARTCTTQKLIEYGTFVVRKSEEQDYRDAGITDLIAVDDELIGGITQVNQWLVDHTPEEIICILDDDINHFYYRLDQNEELFDPETITMEIERFAQLLLDLNIGFGATDPTTIPYNYTQEFEFRGTSGAIRWINKNKFKSKCNDIVAYNYDLDIVLQELLVNRVILKPKFFCSKGITDTNEGGMSGKTREAQVASIEYMKNKWGRYFRYNYVKNKPNINVSR